MRVVLSRYEPWALALLRIVAAFIFWQHGVQKLFGWLEGNPVSFFELRWLAGVLETFGSIFIALGLFTRPVAFLLSGQMATAYFLSHNPQGFWPILNGGERAVLFCFIFLLLFFAGGGKLTLDSMLGQGK